MDVVNGKIVDIRGAAVGKTTAESKMAADHNAWSGLKPSRARAVDAGGRLDQQPHHAGSSPLRGTEWAPSWVTTPNASDEPWMSPWGGASPTGVPGRSKRQAPDGGRGVGAGHGIAALQPLQPHRLGWVRSLTSSPRWGTDRRQYLFEGSPCSESILDAELTMFESQITRTVSDHLSNLASPSSRSQVISSPTNESSTPGAASSVEKKSSQGARPLLLKRKGSGLSVSDDVQKDAESQSFPQIESKEGTVLEMGDYSASKLWYFRFKYWINNKSRMYVLENTGDFIKYHSLKKRDMFVIYEDGCNNLVVCGRKRTRIDKWDPALDLSIGSVPETPPTSATDDVAAEAEEYKNSMDDTAP